MRVIRPLAILMMILGAVILGVQARALLWHPDNALAAAGVQSLEDDWSQESPRDPVIRNEPAPKAPEYNRPIERQEAFAIMRIPRLGDNWEQPVVRGVNDPALALGIGWFGRTALPGQVGNFAVAGHRCCASTHGEPFADLDTIQDGDKVYVETKTHVYTYVMEDWYLVKPTNGEVVSPVPGKPGVEPTQARITLVTCNPYWGSEERLITHGTLVHTEEK